MTVKTYTVDLEDLRRFAACAKKMGFVFVSGLVQKQRADIFRDYTFESASDYPNGVGQFYLLPGFTDYEELKVNEIDNAHIGRAFAVSSVEGGPFVDFLFWAEASGKFTVELGLRSKFTMSDLRIIKPDKSLTDAYKMLCKLLMGNGGRLLM